MTIEMAIVKIKGILVKKGEVQRDSLIEIEDGIIAATYPAAGYSGVVDYNFSDYYVGPGFIDLHLHGANGTSFTHGGHDDYVKILKYCASHGTTSVLAGISTCPKAETDAALTSFGQYISRAKTNYYACAKILGVHLEGPFISPEKPGAMDPAYIASPSLEQYKLWESSGILKMITLAPEIAGSKEVIEYASACPGVIVSAGHTTANYEQVNEAVKWGLSHLTHFYNAMMGLNHREPGAVGAGLFNPGLTIELISDFIHVHPKMLELAWLIKGTDGICLVTDSVELAGLSDGCYINKNGAKRIVQGSKITTENGTIAGSAHSLDTAVHNMVECGATVWDAWQMASYNPATKLGMEHEIGSVAAGMCADLAVLDKSLKCVASFVDGKMVAGKQA